VKTRIPNAHTNDLTTSPWGAVLVLIHSDRDGLFLRFLAFGLRHPDPSGYLPSVYQRAHRRLFSA